MTEHSDAEASQIQAMNIGTNDVLLGRGGATNNHGGNQRFRLLVAEHQREYLEARKHDKVIIARRIVALVHAEGGRFLQNGATKDQWVEVTEKRAQEKTSQALREGLDVRNNKLRPHKLIKAVRRNSESSSSHQLNAPSSANSKKPRISPGKVVTPKSPHTQSALPKPLQNMSTVNLEEKLCMPTLKEEPSEPFFLPYQPPPVSKQELENACEV
jgi:hypothetical protein